MTAEDLADLLVSLLKRWEILAFIVGALYAWLTKKKTQDPDVSVAAERPARRVPAQVRRPPARSLPRSPAPPAKAPSDIVRQLVEATEEFEREAKALAEEVELEPANRRFVEVLREWIPARTGEIREALRRTSEKPEPALIWALNSVSLVLSEVKELVAQRRDPELRGKLGDADRLADSCYGPVIAYAEAEGLPLSTAHPATQLAPVDLSIWTGFAPTQIAPIFLPTVFFDNLVFWPALAHEVGHDFFRSVRGLDPSLRRELSLKTEEEGALPLRIEAEGLAGGELRRVFGGWLEEIFSDVFGVLMCGPAYVQTMSLVFGAREDAREVLAVGRDPGTMLYDVHPPGHVRVHVGRLVLERIGLREDAERLWGAWMARHGFSMEEPPPLLFPVQDRYLVIPFEQIGEIAGEIVERLYAGPLKGLNGVGLSDISGLDYGPRAQAEARRARDAFLNDQVPSVRDARRVISGAVMAYLERPQLEDQILARAREAIPALGTYEQAPDAYRPAVPATAAPAFAGSLEIAPGAVFEALLLREVLKRPAERLRRR